MPKVYIASQAEQVEFERVCSNCGHKWTARFDIGVSTYVESTKEKAAKNAAIMMDIEKRERFENRDVLCPQCLHFAVDAMYRHFRKGGYAGGILKQYKRAMWMNLAGFAGFSLLPAFILYFAKLNPATSGVPWLSVIALLIVVAFGGIALYKLVGFILGLAGLPTVRRKLGQLSGVQLLELAVACYKGNKDSLDATSFEDVRWNAWFTKPLFYKASAPVAEQVNP